MSMDALETVLHSTMERSRKKLILASVKSNALFAFIFATGRVETEAGGVKITNPLTIGRNPNITEYSYFDRLPLAPTNEFTTVEYGFARVAGSVIFSDQEIDENNGPGVIFKLMKAKLEVLEESIQEKFSTYLYGAGAGKAPYGLAALIPDDPTVGTLGGLDRAKQDQWRTLSYNMPGAVNHTNIEEVLDDILLDMTVRKDKPTVILVGRDLYRAYSQAIRDKLVVNLSELGKAGKNMTDLGFNGFMHQKVPFLYDEDCPANKAYFINTKYLRLHVLKGVNFTTKKLTSPWDMDAIGRRTVWQGQLCLWRAHRTHAVLIS